MTASRPALAERVRASVRRARVREDGGWPRRVVVTGAGGHLGGWIVSILASGGIDVTATAGPGESPARLEGELAAAGVEPARVRTIACDLSDHPCWPEIMAGQDALIHVAAPMPHVMPEAGAALVACARDGTRRVIEAAAAAGIRRVIMTSSIMAALYDSRRMAGHVVTEADWSAEGEPMTAYAEAKTAAERALWQAAPALGMGVTAINPGVIFGPALTSSISPSLRLFGEILQGRALVAPRILLPLVDVRDVAWLHVAALLSDRTIGERIFAVSDQLWLADLVGRVRAQGLDRLPEPRPIDDERARKLADSFTILSYLRHDIGEERWIARGKAAALLKLNWRPIDETIAETVRFLAGSAAARHAA